MVYLQNKLSGTMDRGDGEADLEMDPPCCPENCGGDAYRAKPHDDPELERWKCSDCDGEWNRYGEWIDK